MSLQQGSRLGPYEIVAPLGAGGMGEVYRARDTRLNRAVAVKVLPSISSGDPDVRARFKREAEAIAALNHPHICTLYDIGQDGRIDFLVMEYLEGETLAARLRRGRVPMETLLQWSLQIADALEQAHARGIVHRDLKPANLFVTINDTIKVLDFGVAKFAGLASDAQMATVPATDAGMAVGTAAYMSPEQARGEPIDARSDVFSLGAVLYEVATGQPAFAGATTAVIFEAILNRPVRPLRELATDAPPAFVTLVDHLLAKRPADRPPHGGAVALALRDIRKATDSSSRRGAATRVPSIAVLPFADMSAHKDQEYFCEGMAEELINALSKLPGLRVASRTSAFRFKGAEDIRRIGEQLGVETVLEGSVRTAGTRLRVTAQLTSVGDGYQIWSERYDRQMEDVFDIQDEIARAIVAALKVTLLGEGEAALVKRGTENVEAYHLCLKARHHWFRWTDDGFRRARDLFQQALALDPDYALAIFGVADCHVAAAYVGVPARADDCRRMLERAVECDPSLAEAHAVLGVVNGMWTWRWLEARRNLDAALALNPRSSHVLLCHAVMLALTGRTADAVAPARRSVELDPLMPFYSEILAQVFYYNRQYNEAIAQSQTTLDLLPGYWWAHVDAGRSYVALGDHTGAVASLERGIVESGGIPYAIGWYGHALAAAGRRADAEEQLRRLLARADAVSVAPLSVAFIYAGLGDHDNAFAWLERAYAVIDPWVATHLGPAATLDDLRHDARFEDLQRRVGLAGLK